MCNKSDSSNHVSKNGQGHDILSFIIICPNDSREILTPFLDFKNVAKPNSKFYIQQNNSQVSALSIQCFAVCNFLTSASDSFTNKKCFEYVRGKLKNIYWENLHLFHYFNVQNPSQIHHSFRPLQSPIGRSGIARVTEIGKWNSFLFQNDSGYLG